MDTHINFLWFWLTHSLLPTIYLELVKVSSLLLLRHPHDKLFSPEIVGGPSLLTFYSLHRMSF